MKVNGKNGKQRCFSTMNRQKIAFDVQLLKLELETSQQSGAVVFNLKGYDSFLFNYTLPLPSCCGTVAFTDNESENIPTSLCVAVVTHLADETILFARSDDIMLHVKPSPVQELSWHNIATAAFDSSLFHANGVHTLAGHISGEVKVLRYSQPAPDRPRISGYGSLPAEEYNPPQLPRPPSPEIPDVPTVVDRLSPPPPPPEPEPIDEPLAPFIIAKDPVFCPRLSATSIKYFIDVSDGLERQAEYIPGYKPAKLREAPSPPPKNNVRDVMSIPQKRRLKKPVVKSREYIPKVGRKKYEKERLIPWY